MPTLLVRIPDRQVQNPAIPKRSGKRVESSSRRSRRRQRADRDDGPPRTEGTSRHDHPDRRRRTQPDLHPRPARHPVAARLRGPGRYRLRALDPDPGADQARLPARAPRREPAQQRPAGRIQIATFGVSGAITIACAVGMRRAMAGLLGRNLGAAADRDLRRRADGRRPARRPGLRFLPGAPAGKAMHISWHAAGHLISASIGFTALIVACFVMARYFSRERHRGLAIYSRASGLAFLAAFAGVTTGIAFAPSRCRSTPACSSPGSGSR